MLTFTSRCLFLKDLQCKALELKQAQYLSQISLAVTDWGKFKIYSVRKLTQYCTVWNFVGGDSGLDGLGGPGVQLGSPDKKKRKANTQVNSLWFFWFLNSALRCCVLAWLSHIVQNISLFSRIAATYKIYQLFCEGEICIILVILRTLNLVSLINRFPKTCKERSTVRLQQLVFYHMDLIETDFLLMTSQPLVEIYTAWVVAMRLSFFLLLFLYVQVWGLTVQFINALTKLLAYSPSDFSSKSCKADSAPFQWIPAIWHFYYSFCFQKRKPEYKPSKAIRCP